jgi:hypothetical protein
MDRRIGEVMRQAERDFAAREREKRALRAEVEAREAREVERVRALEGRNETSRMYSLGGDSVAGLTRPRSTPPRVVAEIGRFQLPAPSTQFSPSPARPPRQPDAFAQASAVSARLEREREERGKKAREREALRLARGEEASRQEKRAALLEMLKDENSRQLAQARARAGRPKQTDHHHHHQSTAPPPPPPPTKPWFLSEL